MAKAKQDHYKTLGVNKDATAADIKRAYRCRAKSAHPDKGGDHAEMSGITLAYRVLSNDDTRHRYDTTGDDRAITTIEQQVQACLMEAFNQGIQAYINGQERQVLIFANAYLKEIMNKQAGELQKIDQVVEKLNKKRSQVTRKQKKNADVEQDNWFHSLIDQGIQQAEAQRQQVQQKQEIVKQAIEQLKEYQEEQEIVQVRLTATGTYMPDWKW